MPNQGYRLLLSEDVKFNGFLKGMELDESRYISSSDTSDYSR